MRIRRLLPVVVVLLLFVCMGFSSVTLAAGSTLDRAALDSKTVPELQQYAKDQGIDLGSATSKETIIGVILDVQAKKAGTDDFKLPDRELFRPIMPDLSKGTIPGNAMTLGRIGLALFAIAVLMFAGFRFVVLAAVTLAGKKSLAHAGLELLTYLAAVIVILLVFGGFIYQFLVDAVRFARFSAN